MSEQSATIDMKFNVSDIGALHDAAMAAYMKSGGGQSEEAAISFLGTRTDPKLDACLAEVLCDRDTEQLFEPVY